MQVKMQIEKAAVAGAGAFIQGLRRAGLWTASVLALFGVACSAPILPGQAVAATCSQGAVPNSGVANQTEHRQSSINPPEPSCENSNQIVVVDPQEKQTQPDPNANGVTSDVRVLYSGTPSNGSAMIITGTINNDKNDRGANNVNLADIAPRETNGAFVDPLFCLHNLAIANQPRH